MAFLKKMGEYEKNAVLNIVRRAGQTTRSKIFEETGIRRATITEITKQLIDQGLLIEGGNGEYQKKLLQFNGNVAAVIGADIQPDGVLVLLTDAKGRVLCRRQSEVRATDHPDAIMAVLFQAIDDILQELQASNLLGIGISITGVIDKEKRVVLSSSQLQNFSNIPIADMIFERYGTVVLVEDSAPLNLICERTLSAKAQCDDIIYLEIGHGIGAGILSNGTLIKGHLGMAGEIGHSVMDPLGALCMCGNRGCLRTRATSSEIVRRIVEYINKGIYTSITETVSGHLERITIHTVLEAAEKHDKLAINILDDTATQIGIATANAVNMLNPQMLILGGQMFSRSHYMLEPIGRAISKNILPMFANTVSYHVGEFIGDGGALGACISLLDQHFESLFIS